MIGLPLPDNPPAIRWWDASPANMTIVQGSQNETLLSFRLNILAMVRGTGSISNIKGHDQKHMSDNDAEHDNYRSWQPGWYRLFPVTD